MKKTTRNSSEKDLYKAPSPGDEALAGGADVDAKRAQANALSLQLLTLNAMFEHARSGARADDPCAALLKQIIEIRLPLEADAESADLADLPLLQQAVLQFAGREPGKHHRPM